MVYIPYVIAGLSSWLLTRMAIWLAHRWGWLDYPGDERKIHKHPTPRLGGLPLFLAWTLAVATAYGSPRTDMSALLGSLMVGSGLLIGVGILDDLGKLHPQIKLFVAMPLAALLMLQHAEVRLFLLPWPWLNLVLTFLWLVGIPAAFNLIDGVDGLCAGVAGLTIKSFSLMLWLEGSVERAQLGWLLVAALLGFLPFNIPPARIFLGDAGAMLLGFSAAVLGILAKFSLPPVVAWTVPAIMLGLPIFDTTLVSVSRLRRGLVPFLAAGRDHVHHRLLAMGLSPWQVTMTLWAVAATLNILGLVLWRFKPPLWVYFVAVGLLMALAILLGWRLERFYERTMART